MKSAPRPKRKLIYTTDNDHDGRKNGPRVVMVNQTPTDKITVALAYQSSRQLRATINGKINNGSFIIYDGSGRKVENYRVTSTNAGMVLNIDLSGYRGLYSFQLVTDRISESHGKILLR